MKEFKLPDLGEGIHEGELLKWYVNVGENINEDDPLCDVETDKAAVTIPSPYSGKVIKLNGEVGETLFVGNVLAVIGDGSAQIVEEKAAPKAEAKPEPEVEEKVEKYEPERNLPVIVKDNGKVDPNRKVAAAPATRKLARELGIDIKQVAGTGPGGRVTAEDVRNFASGKAPASNVPAKVKEEVTVPVAVEQEISEYTNAPIPFLEVVRLPDFAQEGPVEREQIRSLRRKVATKTTSSMLIVPHVAHMDEIDVTEIEKFRLAQNERLAGEVKLTLMPFMIKAVSSLLKKYPMFNASLDPHRNEIVYKKYYNMGFAADTPRGLIVPVVKDADRKSILDIAKEVKELADKGRDGSIGVEEMRAGTFSITNVGPIGGTGMIPTINYPEVAILGMARVQEKPVVRDGEIVIRKILPVTLAFDHRVADGAQAATFVSELIKRLSDPSVLLLES